MAAIYGQSDRLVFILAIISTLGLQIISNLANDYGDGVKGTDNDERIGPQRALQSGSLSRKELRTGIRISVFITLSFIGLLLYTAFNGYPAYILLFSVLGIAAIWAAIKYTVGDSAYGYKGLGDLFVFCFFGLLSVLGSLFLFTKALGWPDVLPAITVGLLSTAVLNLNNMRDYTSDSRVGKNTLVVKLGIPQAKAYHFILLLISLLCMLFFLMSVEAEWYQFLCLLVFIPLTLHALKVRQIQSPVDFDPELKKVALSTFFMALLFYLGFNIFL